MLTFRDNGGPIPAGTRSTKASAACSKESRLTKSSWTEGPASAGPSSLYARHGRPLGGGSPLGRLVAPTPSRRQLRRREAGWEGSRWRNRDPRNTNRMRGVSVRASQQRMVKPDATKGPLRRCGGCAVKVAGLIRGDLRGCLGMPGRAWRDRRVGGDGGGREVAARRGEVSRGRSTDRDRAGGREGPNAKPSVRRFVLVAVAVTAANPARGLVGKVGG
jgi:hypothetical protein